tara:strand:+ start:1483 stop:1869 length:387 start_codon:yes stop_codon:yes gene_type:complete
MDSKTQKNMKTYGGEKFNFGELNKDHTKAVKEACEILKSQGVDENIIKDLQIKFNVKELPKYDINESPMFQFCKKLNIVMMEQGFVTVKENGEIKQYPVGILCEDIRILNKLFESIFNAGVEAADQIK